MKYKKNNIHRHNIYNEENHRIISLLSLLNKNASRIAGFYNVNESLVTETFIEILMNKINEDFTSYTITETYEYIIEKTELVISQNNKSEEISIAEETEYDPWNNIIENILLKDALSKLEKDEYMVIKNLFGLEDETIKSFTEVAEKYNLTEYRVIALKKSSMEKLKQVFLEKTIKSKYAKSRINLQLKENIINNSPPNNLGDIENIINNYKCFGSYKKYCCIHNVDNYNCPRTKECEAKYNKKNGKCICEFKSQCSPIRQNIQMKFRPKGANNGNCEFYSNFHKD